MQCPSCRADNRATNAFCEACGASLQLTCSACGQVNRPDSRFCGHCGNLLASAAAAAMNSSQLLRSLSVSGGEYKRLTVMFADIRNSTGLIASMDPESAMRRIQPVLDAMRDAVHRYDGLVNKVQGDGIMALFGAPRPHEDHAVRGCLAALAMHAAIPRLGDAGLQIRVGLHTGEVVVQAVNNSLYQTYDAAGVAVHVASRLEQNAEGNTTLISGATFAASRQFVEAKSLGLQTLRGISEPTEVFELTGAKAAPASERFRSGPRSSRLSGRKQELAVLEAEMANTKRDDKHVTNVIGIVGDAGLGKSRLCFEFADACRRQGIRVQEARVLSHGKEIPFQPVMELFRNAFNIRPNDSVEVSRKRVIDLLRSRGDFSESLPVVLDFLGLQDSTNPASKQDPTTRKHRLLSFVRQFIHARPHDETVLLLIEDLHWVDQASEEFVEAMVDAVVGTKTLLLLNFRPGYVAPWMQRSHYRQIALGPLQGSEISELLGGLLGDDASLALLSRNIAERAQGNPFFMEELVQSLAERGDFEGDRGAYRLRAGIDVIPLPPTVQAVLSARIDRLEERSRQVLQIAAVVGREVPLAILERVAGLLPDDIAEALSQLRRAELLYELPPFGQGVHAFRHPLIQEVAYQSLLQGRRRELHAAVARAITEQFADRVDEYSALIAFHLERAEDLVAAAQAHVRAAMWIGARDPAQAYRSWMKVRELVVNQPRSEQVDWLQMAAAGQIVNFGWREGLPAEDARLYFEEAKELAMAAGNMRANAMIHAGFGRLLAVRGSADDYVAKVKEGIGLARQAEDPSLEVMLTAGLCHALRLSGRLTEALEVNIEATNRAHEVNKHHRTALGFDIEPWLTALRGQLLIMLGHSDDARSYLDRVIQMDTEHINASDHMVPSISYVDLAWVEGDVRLAEHHAERATSIATRSGNPYLLAYAMACRGLSLIVAGKYSAAIEELNSALDFARRRKAGLEYEPRMLADLANAYRLKGDFSAAVCAADEAIEVSSTRHTRVAESFARTLRAHILFASGEVAEAEAELARAERLIEENGATIYQPLVRDLKQSLQSYKASPRQPADGPKLATASGKLNGTRS
jgi:class 3 adenylate cyclase